MNLRPYQERMIEFIADNPRGALFAGMGLGKTVSVLTALDRLSLVDDVFPALVLAPYRVAQSTWPDEVAKWPHLRHLKIAAMVGTPKERLAALHSGSQILTLNYENIGWLVEQLGPRWPFKTVVADESTKLKSFRLRQGGKRAGMLGAKAYRSARWINLTGTPAPNGLIDLWGQTWFLDREVLGATYTAFTDRWFKQGYDGYSLLPLPHAQAEIEARIAPICTSLQAADYLALPPLIENVIRVQLPAAARNAYDEMEREMFTTLASGEEIEAFQIAAKTMKCLQIANGAAYIGGSNEAWEVVHDAKLDALEEIVEEAAGAPVLVAYHFRSDLERLKGRFGKRLRHLDKSAGTIRDWNDGKIPILAAHPASAGHGLNLQHGGNILAMFGHWWNLEEYQQIVERIGPTRQAQAGLNRPVFVHHIVSAGTVDELVLQRRETKATVQELLMQRMKEKKHV